MAEYRFYFRNGAKTILEADHQHANDLDALDEAEQLAEAFDVEIWQAGRFVARVKMGNAPAPVTDPISG